MEIHLKKKPNKPTIIEGFPGFGLIGTITTEYLIEHLKCDYIGSFVYDELPATIAIHKGELVDPMGVFYNEKYNLVVLHTMLNSSGLEWQIAAAVKKMASMLKTPEIISIEGVSSPQPSQKERVFYFTSNDKISKKLSALGVQQLEESIIIGVTGALLLRSKIPVTCFFAETNSELPDSNAAAKIIKTLDTYLGLKVDPKPLLKQAEDFEKKFKNILQQSLSASKERDKKQMSYLG